MAVDEGVDPGGHRLYAVGDGRARLLWSHGHARAVSLAPDGRHVAYVVAGAGGSTLVIEALDGTVRQEVARCTRASCDSRVLRHAWSPAGDRLVYATSENGRPYVRIVSVTGEVLADITPRHSQSTTVFADPTWSPSGRWITLVEAYWDKWEKMAIPEAVGIADADGSSWRRLIRTLVDRPQLSWPSVTWAPDERRLLVKPGGERPVYVLLTPSGRQLIADDCRRGAADCAVVNGLAWSPDGRRIAFGRGNQLIVATPDMHSIIRRIKVPTAPDRADDSAAGDDGGPWYGIQLAWSPDGRQIAFVGVRGLIVVTPASGRIRRIKIDATRSYYYDPRWSPDASRIALTACSARSHLCREVALVSIASGMMERVFTAPRGDWEVRSHAWQKVSD